MTDDPTRPRPQVVAHAVVSMLHDPAYCAAVFSPARLPELRPSERALLRNIDPRAFATDEHRRARILAAVVDEFPVSAAVLGLPALDAFLSSSEFKQCIRHRGTLTGAFSNWLGKRAGDIGPLEAAVADLRRTMADWSITHTKARSPTAEEISEDPAERLQTPVLRSSARDAKISSAPDPLLSHPPSLRPLRVLEGTLAWYEATRASLEPTPLASLAGQPPRAGAPRQQAHKKPLPHEGLLLEWQAGEVMLGTASLALVRLLEYATPGRARAALERYASQCGATAHEAPEVIDDLVAQGLLIPVAAS